MKCPTTHGLFRCTRDAGHEGECECDTGLGTRGRIVTLDHDARRELLKAATRIAALESVLRLVKTTFCSSQAKGTACDCCKRMREFASSALGES